MRQPPFPTPDAWLDHRVSYGETDAMGVVYYANYLHWFEMARGSFIRAAGLSYRDVEARGVFLPVREAQCRYIRPARFDDELRVRAGISDWGRASLTFVYQILGGAGLDTLMATGQTEHACVGADGRPTAIPRWLKDLLCPQT